MDARRRVAVITAICGFSLGVGIPLLGLTALPRTETVEGYLVWVAPSRHALLLHETAGTERGHDVFIHVPERRAVRVQPGDQPLSALRPGEHLRVSLGRRSHWAHSITVVS